VRCRPDAVAREGVLVEKTTVILGPNQRPRVAGQGDYGERPKDGVDGPSLEAKLAQVSAG
jgi:hypothetical protein